MDGIMEKWNIGFKEKSLLGRIIPTLHHSNGFEGVLK
jgi:hypothetical protein